MKQTNFEGKLKIIKDLCKSKADNKIIELILNKLDKKYSIKKESIYEYGTNEGSENFKLLNLLFYDGLTNKEKNKLYMERKEQIRDLFYTFKDKKFNFNILNKLLDKINNPNYPIQIAFEFNKNGLEKIKIYFSNVSRFKGNLKETEMLINDIFDTINLPNKIKNKEMLGEGINFIGIDFLDNGKTGLKIYTYFHKKINAHQIKKTVVNVFKKYNVNQSNLPVFFEEISDLEYEDWGFLYRVSENGKIYSAKCWYGLSKNIYKEYKNYALLKICFIATGNKGLDYYLRET